MLSKKEAAPLIIKKLQAASILFLAKAPAQQRTPPSKATQATAIMIPPAKISTEICKGFHCTGKIKITAQGKTNKYLIPLGSIKKQKN